MSTNTRIFYACQAVAIANMGTPSGNWGTQNMIHGVQQVGITTNFKLEQAFELGQIEIYQNIEGVPDVEVTLEKDIDGYPLMYLMASTGVVGTSNSGIVSRAKSRCDLRLGIFDESVNHTAAATTNGGAAEVEVYCSGMYISNLSYKMTTDGPFTESMTLAGNNKQWLTGANVFISSTMAHVFDGNDSPLGFGTAASPSGGIQVRQWFMVNESVLPQSIYGVVGSGVGNGYNAATNTNNVHLQSVNISTDFSRQELLELGFKNPYARPANFPIEVKCEIEAISTSGDFVSALQTGNPNLYNTIGSGDNTAQETIYVYLKAGMGFDLGNKNRLSSVSYGGGDAKGGNVTVTYSYSTFNAFDVYQVGHTSITNPYTGV